MRLPPSPASLSLSLALACAAALTPARGAAQQALIGVPSELTTGNLVPGTWVPGDVHVHTDHSHDAGLPHQQPLAREPGLSGRGGLLGGSP